MTMKDGISTEVFRAEFAADFGESETKEIEFVSWGDYQSWSVFLIRDAIIDRYGADSVSEMKKDDKGYWYFDASAEVDYRLIGQDIGVSHSGPSSSSSSTG